jgi:hypothetical protein
VPAVRHAGRLWGRRRTGAERGRIFASLIYPRFGNRPIESIKRSDIVRLLDDIGEKHGPHRAQVRLAILSTPFNWQPARTFLSPIRRGMTRLKPPDYGPGAERRRDQGRLEGPLSIEAKAASELDPEATQE